MLQIYQRKEMLITIIAIISATGHINPDDIYPFFLLLIPPNIELSFLYLLCPQKTPQLRQFFVWSNDPNSNSDSSLAFTEL